MSPALMPQHRPPARFVQGRYAALASRWNQGLWREVSQGADSVVRPAAEGTEQ